MWGLEVSVIVRALEGIYRGSSKLFASEVVRVSKRVKGFCKVVCTCSFKISIRVSVRASLRALRVLEFGVGALGSRRASVRS